MIVVQAVVALCYIAMAFADIKTSKPDTSAALLLRVGAKATASLF